MTPFPRRRNPYVNRMAEDMQIRNLAASTIDSYTWHVDKFCSHFGKMPEELGPEEIRQYQIFLVHEKKSSWSSFNLTGMMHLSVNLFREKDLTELDCRLAGDSANLLRP